MHYGAGAAPHMLTSFNLHGKPILHIKKEVKRLRNLPRFTQASKRTRTSPRATDSQSSPLPTKSFISWFLIQKEYLPGK